MLYLTKIRNAESEFTENEQKIADFLRANVSELKSVSSRKMAKQLGISQSSIVKFAQKLGAQGFTELRMALIGEYTVPAGRKRMPRRCTCTVRLPVMIRWK